MSELLTFAQLGFRHIVDAGALDHILFLVALAAIYRLRDVRSALWVVTAFTVGHSITLALAITGRLVLSAPLIEFLIPVTIVVTGLENILVRDREQAPWSGRYRPILAGVFGLVHGAGFANYLRALFVDDIAAPLLGFNLGIEAGQVLILGGAAMALAGVDRILSLIHAGGPHWPVLRVRTVAVSVGIVAVASVWAAQRAPW